VQELRVLVVEDAPRDAELALRELTKGGIGCRSQVVATEQDFRGALRDFQPDVILSDFTMHGFDGMTALGIAAENAPDVPFIFLSGTLGEERAIEALKRGATDYLLKSNLARLAPAVRRALEEATSRRARRTAEERVGRLTRMLRMQSGINAAVVRIRDREELLREACRLAMQVGGYQHAMVSLVSPDGRIAKPWYWANSDLQSIAPQEFSIGNGIEPDTSVTGRALRTGEIAVCTDLSNSEPPVIMREELLRRGLRSMVALPFIVDGARVAALSLLSSETDLLRDEELALLQEIRSNLSFALQYRQKEDAFEFLAYFDPLTGLAKRTLFCERLDDLLQHHLGPAVRPTVVTFDVDRLASVNDSLGRHIGDLLLQRVADRLKHSVDDDSRIGYLGGGTFALLLPDAATSEENATALLESTVFRESFDVEGRALRVSFKSGIARYPHDGEDGNTLVQRAEAALKQAKASGELYLHYQLQMHSDMAERLGLEHKLRVALDEQQFTVHYQPQIDIATGRIESAEALLRWIDPDEGLIMPAKFLHILESSGMIVAVGEWVLGQVAADCLRWQQMGMGPLRVAVNVAALQIRRRTFVENVLKQAVGWAEPGYGIDLEITETGLLQDLEGTSRKLHELREAGLRIAIDDFGTGYSSLALLSKLPVDLLKIDRSFISGLPADRASLTLVSSIIGLASAFDLVSVAEGVETREQLGLLRRFGCHQSQGYLHSRPVPVAELEQLFAEQRAALGR
jgi:diguanylate cyclase (GGDEF)-like protein